MFNRYIALTIVTVLLISGVVAAQEQDSTLDRFMTASGLTEYQTLSVADAMAQ